MQTVCELLVIWLAEIGLVIEIFIAALVSLLQTPELTTLLNQVFCVITVGE